MRSHTLVLATSLPLLWFVLGFGAAAAAQTEPSEATAPSEVPAEVASEAEAKELARQLEEAGLSPGMVEKLSSDHLHDLLDTQIRRTNPQPAEAEAIIVPIVVFGCAFGIVAVVLFARFRRDQLKHATLRAMVEKGVEIPADLISPPEPIRPPNSDLRRGLFYLMSGLGICLFFTFFDAPNVTGLWSVGLIPALIGGGYLLTWRLEQGKKGHSPI